MQEKIVMLTNPKLISSDLLVFNEVEDSKHDQVLQQQFYNKFCQDNRLLSCKIVGTIKIQGSIFKRSYAIYQIEIITEDLHYNINKRYSQFRQLYLVTKDKSFHDEMTFPAKTYLRSSVDQQIISQRKENLNKFLSDLVDKNHYYSEVKFRLYKFLQLWENYHQRGFNEEFISENKNTTQQFITLQIMKLNGLSKSVSKIFEVVIDLIMDKNKRLSSQCIRKLLFGFADKKGTIQFTLSHNNEIVIIEGLKFLLSIMDSQQNKQAESYCKIFSTCNCQNLILSSQNQQQFLSNSVIKNHYFQLLRIYLERKQKLNWKLLFGTEHQIILKNYLFWQRSQRIFNDTITQSESLSTQKKNKLLNKCSAFRTATSFNGLKKSFVSQSSSTKQRKQSTINFIDTLLKQLESYDEMEIFNYEILRRQTFPLNQSIQMRVSDNNQVIKFLIKSAYNMQQLKKTIMPGCKQWNSHFASTEELNQENQIFIRNIFLKKIKPKRYKFQLDISQQNGVCQIVKYPMHSMSGDFCLIETIILRENKGAQIQLNFGMCHKNVADYFSQEFSGQHSFLCTLIKQTLIK